MMKKTFTSLAAAAAALFYYASAALAQESAAGMAKPWQLWTLESASPVKEELMRLNDAVHYVIACIVVIVLALCLYTFLRYNRRANPVPARFTHNVKIEFIWTIIPIIILVGIAIPSLRVHYFVERDVEAEMTIKVTGRQWYWTYQYPDHGGFEFDSYMKKDPVDPANPKPGERLPHEPRLLEVDNRVVVPVNTTVKLLITASDVIHSWALPSFGVKRDAVPGRLNETWFKATKTGVFYGQCSELCGKWHGFMPIAVEVVSKEQFDAWVQQKQSAAGIAAPATPALARIH